MSLSNHGVSYSWPMQKLWEETIEAHRTHVTAAILHTAAHLVGERGLRAVTMSEIAEQTGIGRATLYKYFSDVESILLAWHELEITNHLEQLAEIRNRDGAPYERLAAVLEAYAFISYETRGHHESELGALLHRHEHVPKAEERLRKMIRDLIKEAAAGGEVRSDVAADELVSYCLNALNGTGHLPSKAAVHRLVAITLDGLRN